MRSLPQQLRDAWKGSKLTLEQLITRADIDTSIPSLCRKLSGEQVMTTEECQALAQALGVTLVWVPDDGAAA